MLDFLFALGQFLCVVGLIYGFILVMSHGDCVDSMRAHYDPVTGHDWLTIKAVHDPSAYPASPLADRQSPDQGSARDPHAA